MQLTVDDIVKLVFFISISISLLGISIQLMRILGKMVGVIEDARVTLQNFGEFSKQLVEDYKTISSFIKNLSGFFNTVNNQIIQPLTRVTNTVGGIFGKRN